MSKLWYVHQYDSHDEYVKAQVKANIRKEKFVWVKRHAIQKISKKIPIASSILCHGTRNGAELRLFEEFYPQAYVIGTEISETAHKYKGTVQHDFHEPRNEWYNKFDIVYSNSFDHSYDPFKVLTTWTKQLKTTGRLIIEYQKQHKDVPSDPLVIEQRNFEFLVKEKFGMKIQYKGKGSRNGVLYIFSKGPRWDYPPKERDLHVREYLDSKS